MDVTIPFTKLHILFEGDKALREKKVALRGADTGFVGWGATMWGLFRWGIEAFQVGEGVGVAEGVAVSDVLLPAVGLPVTVLLGEVFAVELSEGDGFGVVLIPAVELPDTVLIIAPCVGCRARHKYAPHYVDTDNQAYNSECGKVQPEHISPTFKVVIEPLAVIFGKGRFNGCRD